MHLCLTPNLEQGKLGKREVYSSVVSPSKIDRVMPTILSNPDGMITSACHIYIIKLLVDNDRGSKLQMSNFNYLIVIQWGTPNLHLRRVSPCERSI